MFQRGWWKTTNHEISETKQGGNHIPRKLTLRTYSTVASNAASPFLGRFFSLKLGGRTVKRNRFWFLQTLARWAQKPVLNIYIYILGCPWKLVTIVSKLGYNLLRGLTTYLYWGYNLVTNFHGHPSNPYKHPFKWVTGVMSYNPTYRGPISPFPKNRLGGNLPPRFITLRRLCSWDALDGW